MRNKNRSKHFDDVYTAQMNKRMEEEIASVPSIEPSGALRSRIIGMTSEKSQAPGFSRRMKTASILAASLVIFSTVIISAVLIGKSRLMRPPLLEVHLQSEQSPSGTAAFGFEKYELVRLPSGFSADETTESEFMIQHSYKNESLSSITLTQYASSSVSPTREYKTKALTDNDNERITVYYCIQEEYADAYWIKNGFLFNLHTVELPVDESSLFELIGSVGIIDE